MKTENYAYQERAAILEYEAGFSREEAEKIARKMEGERVAEELAKGWVVDEVNRKE